MDTSAKGRRFEYKIRNIFLNQGFVVGRCASSKPWDLTVATTKACYAIECKSGNVNKILEYKHLKAKLLVRTDINYEGFVVLEDSKLVPLLFYKTKTGTIEMYSEATFKDEKGVLHRPYFNDGTFLEIKALGETKNIKKGDNSK